MAKMDPVVHFEMPYKNHGRLSKFYKKAFGWKMQKLGKDMGDYVLAGTTETDRNRMVKRRGAINGGFFPGKGRMAGACPHVVIAVDDLEKTMKKVKAAGGRITGGPMDIPGIGRYVSFTDTEGNGVGALQPGRM